MSRGQTKVIRVGCSGWFYRHWKAVVYPAELPTSRWFEHYRGVFDTVELNAPFYHWPKVATVRSWKRQAPAAFRYTVKVNRLITHLHRFHNTKKPIAQFTELSKIPDRQMGCFLFQLPPSFH